MDGEDTDPPGGTPYASTGRVEIDMRQVREAITAAEAPLESLGKVLCQASEGWAPDDAFWRIGGVPHDWVTGVPNHPAVRARILAVVLRRGGTFELIYQRSSLVDCPEEWAEHTMYSEEDWRDWGRSSCQVTPAASFELDLWFMGFQRAADRRRVLRENMLDDDGVAAARRDLLIANRLDPETVAFERAARLVDAGLTETAIEQQRRQVIEKALAAAGLDDGSVAKLRAKAFEEVTLDDEHLRRAIPRLIQRERLDDPSVALRRELLLKEHGLL